MSSILKVDTIQDQSGNNIINESGNVITIGASGDTITVPAGATVSGFTSAGIDDNATSTAITISSGEDVTFTENILLGDNKKAIFGAGSDLQIYHDSTSGHSFLKESGSGSLVVQTNNLVVQNAAGTANIINAPEGTAGLDLYYNGNIKLSTANNGVSVTGILSATNGNFGSNVNSQGTLNLSNNGAEQLEFFLGVSSGLSQIQAFNRNDSTYDSLDFISLDTRFKISGTEKMRITSAGLVGIGTSSPSEELEVSGGQNTIIKSKTTTSTALGGFEAHGSASSYIKVFQHGPSFGGTTFGGVSGNDQSLIEAQAASSVVFSTQGNAGGSNPDFIFAPQRSQKVIIKSDGKVGIGTSSPSKTLDVAGDATITKNDTPLYLNRTGSDGEVLRVSKDGTQNGYLGIISADFSVTNATATNGAGISLQNNLFVTPMKGGSKDTSSAVSLGNTSYKWKDIYLGGGAFIGGTGDANKLDDYEEGTHVVTMTDTGSGATITPHNSYKTLAYVKVGRLVHFQGVLLASAVSATMTGTLRISLPFASATISSGAGRSYVTLGAYNVDFTAGTAPYGAVAQGASFVDGVVSGDNITGGQYRITTSSQIYIAGSYYASA